MVRNSAEQREYLGDRPVGRVQKEDLPVCRSLPEGFRPLDGSVHADQAPYLAYLRSRGVSSEDRGLYRIGYVDRGPYAGRVVVPSFDRHGRINFWSARSIHKWEERFRYMLPREVTKDVISNEHLVDWTKPVYLVEGAFDELALGPQAIALYGKFMLQRLAVRLVEMKPPMVHVCLDDDAYDEAYQLLGRLLSYDLPCSLVELPGKDPSVAGQQAVHQAADAAHSVSGSTDLVRARL